MSRTRTKKCRERSNQRTNRKSGRETRRNHGDSAGEVQGRSRKDDKGEAEVSSRFAGIRDIIARGKFPVFLRDPGTREDWIILAVYGEWVRYYWLDQVCRSFVSMFGPKEQEILWQPK